MDIERTKTIQGLLDEYANYEKLLADLTPQDGSTPTRCAGWDVHDVVAHVVGLASDSFAGRIGRFSADEQAAMRRELTFPELADELEQALTTANDALAGVTDETWDAASGAPDLTIAEGLLTVWYDAWVHRDDVLAALGRPADAGPGLEASVQYLRWTLDKRGWQPPAGVDLDDLDPHAFVLAATGRGDPSSLGLDPSVNVYA